MVDRSIEQAIAKAQAGDQEARIQLITQYRPFIITSATRICKRPIMWEHDEASIALIALNEAIDRYEDQFGQSFMHFAYINIQRRLIDEFRRRGRVNDSESLSMDYSPEGMEQSYIEVASAMEVYEREQRSHALAQELLLYDEQLQEYGVLLEELEDCSPKHKDARQQQIEIAKHFSAQMNWVKVLKETRRLPIKEMLIVYDVSKKTLERNRKYLIALILLFAGDEFEGIRNTVSFTKVEVG